jgi:GNAT superfamily N-acetyltransferase
MPPGDFRLEQVRQCPPSFYRYLYREVGRAWFWVERANWTDDRICDHLAHGDIDIWLLSADGGPAGYFELRRHLDGSIEIAYFGLLPEFIGRGLGSWFLTAAVDVAWAQHPTRVWLHTCTLDHPAALPNYLARGFRVTRTEEAEVEQ